MGGTFCVMPVMPRNGLLNEFPGIPELPACGA